MTARKKGLAIHSSAVFIADNWTASKRLPKAEYAARKGVALITTFGNKTSLLLRLFLIIIQIV